MSVYLEIESDFIPHTESTVNRRMCRIGSKKRLFRTKARGVINCNVNDVLNKHKDRPAEPTLTVPKKNVILVLPHLGLHSDAITRRLKSCVIKVCDFVNLSVIFQNTRRITSFFPFPEIEDCLQKSVAGIVMLSTSVKLKDYMTERMCTSTLLLKLVTPPLLLIIQFLPVTTSNGTILRS